MKKTPDVKGTSESAESEREKLELEKQQLQSDNDFRRAELEIKREELNAKLTSERRNVWFTSSTIVALLGLLASLLAAGVGASLQGRANTELERSKFEYTLIQKALETKDKREAAKNLKFLVEAGIIQSLNATKIASLADKPENLPTSPLSSGPINAFFEEGTKFKDALQQLSEVTGISISDTGCESVLNTAIKAGNMSAGNPATLIEMLKYRIKDPAVKVDYHVKEVEAGTNYVVVCMP